MRLYATISTEVAFGTVIDETYDSFGKLTASTGSLVNPFQYTARKSDSETGLYYYRARYYDPAIGRFLAEDPSGFKGGIDHYPYVDNMPLNFIDPFGLCPCAPSGHAPDPSFYAGLGESAGWFHNDVNLFEFHRGGLLDAQADGGSTAYANYVFGVYMNAAGYSLSQTLAGANAYAYLFAHYPPNKPKDPKYPSIPAVNVANITAGFNTNKNGTLCTISE